MVWKTSLSAGGGAGTQKGDLRIRIRGCSNTRTRLPTAATGCLRCGSSCKEKGENDRPLTAATVVFRPPLTFDYARPDLGGSSLSVSGGIVSS
jgi:hypothetical protein